MTADCRRCPTGDDVKVMMSLNQTEGALEFEPYYRLKITTAP